MKKATKFYYLLTVLSAFLCACSTETHSNRVNEKETEIKKISAFTNLLHKFEEIDFDTLKVFSEEEFIKFKGQPLDSLDALLFPKEIAELHFLEVPGIFACYKFSIDSNRIGLIARTPSEYLPSSIKLFIYDKKTDAILNYIELAENFGDAGYCMDKSSWIIKNKRNMYQALIVMNEMDDHSVEESNDTTIEQWSSDYLVDLSKPRLDTITTNSKLLKRKFGYLLKH